MPVYEYTALDARGKTKTGIIDAESSPAAKQKLRSSKIYPVSIKEIHKTIKKKGSKVDSLLTPFTRVKPAEITMMTRQLSTLVGAGFPLVSAIDTLLPQTKSQAFKKTLAKIKDSIVEGNSFAASLSLFPSIFSPLYINMVSAGEASGTLEIVLERLAEIREKQQELNNKIRSALAYPIFMALIGVAVLLFLMGFIVPRISSIFSDMDQVLPMPTQILIHISDFIQLYWWVLFGAIAMLIVGVQSFKKTKKGRYIWDRMVLKMPGFGVLAKKLAVARFSRTLGSLLENGITMLTALEIVKNIVGNIHLSEAIEEAAEEVGKGQGLGVSLEKSDIFPNLTIQMIQVGEQTGELEPMLKKIADVFEGEVESTVLAMTSLLEPVMILVMGVVVGFIVLSICLPIMEMNQLIR